MEAVVNPSDAVNEVIGAVRGVLGLSRQSRLREQIKETTELYGKVKEHDELKAAATDIARVVTSQAARLLEGAEPGSKRAWAWGPFAIGLVFTLLVGAATWGLYRLLDRTGWWLWLGIVPLGLFSLLCLAASFSLLLEPKPAGALSPTSTEA